MTEAYYFDFVKGNPEQASIVESIDKGTTRNVKPNVAVMTEIQEVMAIKQKISTAIISEHVIITLINGPTSIVNGSEINSFALNG